MNVIGIDFGIDKSSFMLFSLLGAKDNYRQPRVREAEGNIKEQVLYFADVIENKKPVKVVIDTLGMGIALLDGLIGELKKRNILMNKDGDMFYPS